MIPIYMHEYTIIPWDRHKMGLQQITVIYVSDSKDRMESYFAIEKAIQSLDSDCNISHRIVLEGYKQE